MDSIEITGNLDVAKEIRSDGLLPVFILCNPSADKNWHYYQSDLNREEAIELINHVAKIFKITYSETTLRL